MKSRVKQIFSFFGGAVLGTAAMFTLDPVQGRRRRALIRDQLLHGWKSGGWALRGSVVDLRHRAKGAVAEARSRIRDKEVPDDILVARVRSKIGRVVTHPHAVEVSASNGRVKLKGPIPEEEMRELISMTFSVRGVRELDDQLEVYRDTSRIPSLQGEGKKERRRA